MIRTFSYDGHGINGPDEYRTRLATFTEAGKAYPGLGNLLEAAPELLATLEAVRARINGEFDHPELVKMGPLMADSDDDILAWCAAAIAKAKGAA